MFADIFNGTDTWHCFRHRDRQTNRHLYAHVEAAHLGQFWKIMSNRLFNCEFDEIPEMKLISGIQSAILPESV